MGRWEFWAIATVMIIAACATLVVPAIWFQRAPDASSFRRQRILGSLGVVIVLPLAALTLYGIFGSPELTGAAPSAARFASSHPAIDSSARSRGGRLDEAIARLEAKLRADPSNVEGWKLLGQSYAFTGRAAEATRASEMAQRAASGGAVVAPANVPASFSDDLLRLEDRLRKNPNDVEALALLAETRRRQRDFAQALSAFSRLVELDAMSADLWADYADALAASRKGLDAESAALIDKALALDAKHPKALWLLGSWQTQSRDYRGALATWQGLAAVLPPTSPDARIIAANVEEARAALEGRQPGPAPAASQSQPRAVIGEQVALSGEVAIDPKVRHRIPPGATLFVFAKAVRSPGPPLAVMRSAVGSWPAHFNLDDAAAMLPDRKLSAFDEVIVEARISRSGSASAEQGDLRAVSGVLNPRSAGPLRLVISEIIG